MKIWIKELGFCSADDVKTKCRRFALISRGEGTFGYSNIHMPTAVYGYVYCVSINNTTARETQG